MFVLGRVAVEGNATATANNILAHQPLFRSAFAADLLSIACSIVLTVLFYDLFSLNANRTLRAFFPRHAKIAWAIRTHQDASLRQMSVTRPCKTIRVGSATR